MSITLDGIENGTPPPPAEVRVDVAPDPHQQTESSCCGRLWKHPIQIPMAIGTAVGGGFGAFKIVDDDYASGGVAIGLGCVTLIAFIGFIFLVPEKKFEENVEQVGKEVDRVGDETLKLKTENETLQESIKKLEEINRKLTEALEIANASIQTLRDFNEQKDEDIEKLETQVTQLKTLYSQIKKDTKKVVKNVKAFNQQNKVYKVANAELGDHIDSLAKHEDDYSAENEQLDDANEYFAKEQEKLKGLLDTFNKNMTTLQDGYLKVMKLVEQLTSLTGKVDQTGEDFREGTKTVNEIANRLLRDTTELKEIWDELKDVSQVSSESYHSEV